MNNLNNTFLDWKELFRPGSFKEFKVLTHFSSNKIFSTKTSWEKLLFLSELAHLTYTKNAKIREEVLSKFNLEEVSYFSHKGAQFMLIINNNRKLPQYICCFRGTDDFFDYKNILTFGHVNWKNKGVVYKGFKKSFDNIEKEIIKISNEIQNQPIWLVGHSLGGVLAVFSSFFFSNPELNVFGIPKIGDEKFNQNVKKNKINNFCMQNDFITKLPMFTNKFKSLESHTIKIIKLNNKTCPTSLYSHAPINYCTNISLNQSLIE